MTMTLVSTVTVGAGGAASIDFTSIPQTGTDLIIMLSSRNSSGSTSIIQFNSDSTDTNYTFRRLRGSGSAVLSETANERLYLENNKSTDTASTFGTFTYYIPNYGGSTAKSFSADAVSENNATAAFQNIAAGRWTGTSAITSIKLLPNTGNYDQYSTASLYTITKGSGGATAS